MSISRRLLDRPSSQLARLALVAALLVACLYFLLNTCSIRRPFLLNRQLISLDTKKDQDTSETATGN